jgi:2-phospho-L-lactate guanylyltransferase
MSIWAVVPVKELDKAKERLAPLLPPALRRALMVAMLEDVLSALVATQALAGLAIVTVEPEARRLAAKYNARIIEAGAREGHTGAVTTAARLLAQEGCLGMLTLPGDIPLISPNEIEQLLAAHRTAPAFTIAPSHDERGSNAVICSPPNGVPLRFGEDSFFPHLEAAENRGIRPSVLRLPGIALDIDTPEDLAAFAARRSTTRASVFLAANKLLQPPEQAAAPTGDRWDDYA